MTAPAPQSKPTAVEGSQPGTESLTTRLRLNSCQRAHETPDQASTRRITTEFEAADRIEEMTKALEPFAEIAKELVPTLTDDYKNTMAWAVPTVGQLREALRAVAMPLERSGGAT